MAILTLTPGAGYVIPDDANFLTAAGAVSIDGTHTSSVVASIADGTTIDVKFARGQTVDITGNVIISTGSTVLP